ncbi:MAG: ATP-binding protein [Aeromicrobium sp.]|uniref:sensor histidine kinase n=1 Tax=Aeromicrobium sp. TaxID=1871063 RepID=UPI0039E5D3EB
MSSLFDRVTVRSRLALAVTSWTLLALIVTGYAILRVAEHRALSDASADADAVLSHFRHHEENSPTATAAELLSHFAANAVVPPNQSVIAVVDGAALDNGETSAARTDGALRAARELSGGGSRVVASDSATLAYAVLEVHDSSTTGHLVVVSDLSATMRSIDDLATTFALICLAVVIVTGMSAWSIAGRVLSPLRRLQRTAASITAGDLDQRVPVTGRDDLSRLQRTVNSMLDALQSAVTTQRDLLDDVGHELRTPLTIMRGHLETTALADPESVAQTHEIVLEEIDRMTDLVADLLVLADAHNPDFLRRVPTDVDALVRRVVTKVRPLAHRDWRVDTRTGATVDLDPGRITQAVMALVDNAVGHTRTGDLVGVRATLADDELRLLVGDSGPGVPAQDRERVFDRFGRGRADQSRRDSHGLGLAITSAIAEAHGGRVRLLDPAEPGAFPGATFEIAIPAQEEA